MNISDEAVEVAAKYLADLQADPDGDYTMEARDLLRAAAPHLMAEAWQEGFIEALKYAPTPSSGVMNNPYRAAGVGE